jgi:2-C-methyl-D-erythritol 4-phosphate cytidylyltransferase
LVGPNLCGGSRAAAAPDADVAALTVEEGPGLVARLREALDAAPNATRFLLNFPSALTGEGQGGGYDVTVVALPITDTCKEVVDGLVRRTIPRDTLVDARGPWTFGREALMQALDRVGTGSDISNLIELCRAARLRVRVQIPQ